LSHSRASMPAPTVQPLLVTLWLNAVLTIGPKKGVFGVRP